MNLSDNTIEGALGTLSQSCTGGTWLAENRSCANGIEDWGSSRIHEWPVTRSWWMPIVFTSAYLLFVLDLGPRAMARRKSPFNLRYFALAYNALMVVYSTAMLYQIFNVSKTKLLYLLGSACRPIQDIDRNTIDDFDSVSWYYMLSKYIEFIDTVIFILRQKQNQVTFLHVYHHSNMALSTWIVVKYLRERHLLVILILNSFVHVCMYSYYLLSALGPKFRKYLWWKPYLTRLQIGQFLAVIGYQLGLYLFGCPVNNYWIVYSIFNTTAFLLLFLNFYWKAYRSKAPKVSAD